MDPTRRKILETLVLGATGATIGGRIGSARAESVAPVAAAGNMPGTCVLTPQAMEGPYYFDPKMVRADITEGKPGAPLSLLLKIVESGSCKILSGARVDIWHCDATGIYSGYGGQGDDGNQSTKGQYYLRGTQFTDANGVVSFRTIYPGWYPGRTPHVHIKVFLDDRTLLTGQIYFPDALSARVYKERAPYSGRPIADTANAQDFIFREGDREGGGIVLAMSETPSEIVGSLLIAADRTGSARRSKGGGFWRRLFGAG